MNYYIVTDEVFNTLIKSNISFMLKSIDGSKRIVITSDKADGDRFDDAAELSQYTVTNTDDWVGDGNGVEETTFDEIKYIPEIDD